MTKLLEHYDKPKHRRVEVDYGRDTPPTSLQKGEILELVALRLFPEDRASQGFSRSELEKTLGWAIRETGYSDRPKPLVGPLLQDLNQNHGLLQGDEDRGYFFLHLAIQEFLAASALAHLVNEKGWESPIKLEGRTGTIGELVDKKAWHPRWHEVIGMLAGRLDEPGPLLGRLSNSAPTLTNPTGDDIARHRLALAALCLPDIPIQQRGALHKQIDAITTRSFAAWWRASEGGQPGRDRTLGQALKALAQVNGRVPSGNPATWALLSDGSAPFDGMQHTLLDCLAELLHDRGSAVRAAAVRAVGRLGPAAAPDLVVTLVERLHDRDSRVREAAAGAVEALGPAAATALAELLRNRDFRVQHMAVEVVGVLGPAAAPALGATLTELLHDRDSAVRAAAAVAVGELGPAAAPALGATLAELLHDRKDFVRAAAVRALGRLGPAAAPTSARPSPSCSTIGTTRCSTRRLRPWV